MTAGAADDHEQELEELFLQETGENLELLTMSLIALERCPDDTARIQDAFRAAHSCKGMAGAMGHSSLGRVLHALEDLLGDVREGVVRAEPEAVSAMLRTVDLCSSMLASIEATGDGDADVDDEVDELERTRSRLRAAADRHRAAESTDAATIDPDVVAAIADAGLSLLVVDVHPQPSTLMPAARAYAAMLQAQRVGDVVGSDPVASVLEAGELPAGTLRLWLATDRAPGDVHGELVACTEIESVDVAPFLDEAGSGVAAAPTAPVPQVADATGEVLGRGRTVRVESSRLDALMHGMGELLVQRSRLESIARTRVDPELREVLEDLARAAGDLQATVMDVRMVAIDVVFRRLPRLVRDLEQALDRRVDLLLSGADTELDRTVIELLGDPLVHLVRNAVDHGIEPPEERIAAGKPPAGTLAISAAATGGVVVLRVRDDGRGMQPDQIRARAAERGLAGAEELAAMADEQVVQLCFAPGFSTRTDVTDYSGRGVGLDVVRSSVRALGGDVTASSGEGGTVMTIRLPLTLAIVPVLLVRVGPHRYAVPTMRVESTLEATDERVHRIAGRHVVDWGTSVVPVVQLGRLLGVDCDDVDESAAQLVVVEASDGSVALLVDEVLVQEDVVTRPMPTVVALSPYLSASAMLGDGEIAFLLDTDAMSTDARKGAAHAAGTA